MNKNKQSLKTTFAEAVQNYQKRDFKTAEIFCYKILSIDTKHFDSLSLLANIFAINKNFEKAYEIAIESQAAALKALKPGVKAEDVHSAYAEVIQNAGYEYPLFRCGRAVGFSFLEEPQLVCGDKTIIKPGMVFAVDGSTSGKNFRTQVGDSFIVNEESYEPITSFPKELKDAVIK